MTMDIRKFNITHLHNEEIFQFAAEFKTLGDTAGFVEKERAIDMIRWDKSDSLSEYDTFGMPTVLAYLVKVAITGRWVKLDPATGREMYDRLVASFDHTKRAPSGE
ncbi:MAG: DUF2764 domain-containing protein [Alistipes sp.]|jgi:hypothetical protein|nr:DUF2764 domain-containing protein [Alistipes sp.]